MMRSKKGVAAGLATVLVGALLFAQTGPSRHVVVVSIDGFRPDLYLDPASHEMSLPILRSLTVRGAFAEAVVGTYPSVTYPSHTTIVTGVGPRRHGIVSNHVFDPSGAFIGWFRHASALRARTLWDAAKAAGGTTAAVSWPVTVGAPIDFNFPEIVPGPDESPGDVMREVTNPDLWRKIESELGALTPERWDGEPRETVSFDVARLLLRKHKPTLLLLHVYETDAAQHDHGREGPEVVRAFEGTDRKLGLLLTTLEEAGLSDRTLLVVTGDHGFADVHSAIRLNVAFRDAGLLRVDASGSVSDWKALGWASGGSCAVVVRDGEFAAETERVVKSLVQGPLGGAMRIVSRSELDALKALPEALFALEATDGYYFAEGVEGAVISPGEDRGYHGYLPTWSKMATGFLMAGPGVRKGVRIPTMRQIDIAPTVSAWAGWRLDDVEGMVLSGLFEPQ